jgi:hypothetical protein
VVPHGPTDAVRCRVGTPRGGSWLPLRRGRLVGGLLRYLFMRGVRYVSRGGELLLQRDPDRSVAARVTRGPFGLRSSRPPRGWPERISSKLAGRNRARALALAVGRPCGRPMRPGCYRDLQAKNLLVPARFPRPGRPGAPTGWLSEPRPMLGRVPLSRRRRRALVPGAVAGQARVLPVAGRRREGPHGTLSTCRSFARLTWKVARVLLATWPDLRRQLPWHWL